MISPSETGKEMMGNRELDWFSQTLWPTAMLGGGEGRLEEER